MDAGLSTSIVVFAGRVGPRRGGGKYESGLVLDTTVSGPVASGSRWCSL